jgi:hypothetical protein
MKTATHTLRSLAAVLLAALVACAVSAACTSVARQESLDAKQARWKTIEVEAPSDRLLWQLTLLAIQTQGYPLGSGTDPGAGVVESGWKTDLQPFRGEGRRWRAVVKMEPVSAGRWKLDARVQCEKNQNLVSPLDPVRAEWEHEADDERKAEILLQHVQARLKPTLEVQPPKTNPVRG